MYVRYKKNIQENDLPRKRVRKASKIAGSGGQYLEIRCPERGRKLLRFLSHQHQKYSNLEIRCPERGRKQFNSFLVLYHEHKTNLEIRCPERGRKLSLHVCSETCLNLFGNKMPREGTETLSLYFQKNRDLFGNKMPREGTETLRIFYQTIRQSAIWK